MSGVNDVITLSSDEETTEPPKKKIKPTFLGHMVGVTITRIPKNNTNESKAVKKSADVVILSDEEDLSGLDDNEDKNEVIIKNNDNNVKDNFEEKNNLEIEDDTEDCCEIITDKQDNECEIVEDKKIDCETVKPNSFENSAGKENISENIISNENNEEISDVLTNNIEKVIPKEVTNEPDELESSDVNHADSTISTIETKESSALSSSKSSQTILLESYLKICEESIKNSQYEDRIHAKLPIIWKYYKKCELKLAESSGFEELLLENTKTAQQSAARAVISFKEVFQHMKDVVDAESIEVPKETRIKLKKFEKTIALLVARIKQLENSEIDFDDEEDSVYLQLDRFTSRLNKVYSKYCELLNKNPHSGRITYAKLDFVDSEYNEINRAISKKYKNNQKFPSYIEMENYVKKIATENNLQLSEAQIKNESVHCFKKLGELLQNRRKRELYDTHYLYIKDNDDPASKDLALNSTLKENYTEGQNKIDKLCQSYVNKQDLGEEAILSEEDSDKSNYADSDNEEANV